MDWIRKNPHLLTLILVGVVIAAASAVAAMNAQSFNEKFAPVQQTVIPGEKIPPLDYGSLDRAQEELTKPVEWTSPKDPDPKNAGDVFPFVPGLYSIENGHPLKSGEGFHWKDPLTQKPIPDRWFIDHNLPVTDPTVGQMDPDGDGFSNADEWRGGTDPNGKTSHPPYYTKLFLKQMIKVPFRLKFNAYDGDPARDKPETISFQINTLDLRIPSEFLKIGDTIRNTKYKLEKFEYKTALDPAIQDTKDVSELTVLNTETNEPVKLIYQRVVDSPDVYADFTYLWPKPPLDIKVGKTKKFLLLPEKDQIYILVDINDTEAVIKTPANEEKHIVHMPAGYP